MKKSWNLKKKNWIIMDKSWNLKKKWIIVEKSWYLWNNLTIPPVARKLAVGHTGVWQLVFWLLVVSSLNYFKMYAWSTSMLLLLHSAFTLSVVKMLLKVEVEGCALNCHGNNIVDQRKSWNCFFGISVGTLCLYTGKCKISVKNITFYLLKSVQNINNSSWN